MGNFLVCSLQWVFSLAAFGAVDNDSIYVTACSSVSTNWKYICALLAFVASIQLGWCTNGFIPLIVYLHCFLHFNQDPLPTAVMCTVADVRVRSCSDDGKRPFRTSYLKKIIAPCEGISCRHNALMTMRRIRYSIMHCWT
jgi:hypothetical protein